MRFLLIDIWVLKLIIGVGGDASLRGKISNIHKTLDKLREYIVALPADGASGQFRLENYAGVNVSEAVAKKKIIEQGYRMQNYYPAITLEN